MAGEESGQRRGRKPTVGEQKRNRYFYVGIKKSYFSFLFKKFIASKNLLLPLLYYKC